MKQKEREQPRRLKPSYALQVVREPQAFKNVFALAKVILAPAVYFLSLI
jgi:hypothetical protein